MGSGREPLKPFLSAELAAVVARAYDAFDLPIPRSTGVCVNCCLEPEIEADFLNHAARDLPPHYVRDWYGAAVADTAGFAEIGWILPRAMELLARGEDVALVGDEAVFQRLALTAYPERWAPRRIAAVNDFALALMRARLGAACVEVDATLCMFARGGVDIRPLLRTLWDLPDDDLARVLWDDLWPYRLEEGLCMSAFWAGPQKPLAREWYTARRLRDRMLAHGRAEPEPRHSFAALRIAEAIDASEGGMRTG